MNQNVIVTALMFVFLVGCSGEKDITYKMPDNFETQTFVVDAPDGFPMKVYAIEEPAVEETNYDRWLAWREKTEAQDKYAVMRHVWKLENELNFNEREEERIEEYCKEYGYARCKDIDRTCEKDGCHRVTVVCDDDNYDEGIDRYDECRKFDVQVDEEIDDELTEETDEDIKNGDSC